MKQHLKKMLRNYIWDFIQTFNNGVKPEFTQLTKISRSIKSFQKVKHI